MKKRHIVWALIFIVVGIVLGSFPVKSKTNGEVLNDNYKYVAIGDEVALEDYNRYEVSYVTLIKDFLYSLNKNLDYKNLGYDGITSSELIGEIENNKEAIEDADLITIAIGGHNIIDAVLDNLSIDKSLVEGCSEEEFDKIVSEYLNNNKVTEEILKSIEIFSEDFKNIIKKVKSLAPKAEIYINTIYNPINKKCNIYDFFDSKIKLMNDIIEKNNKNNNYKILDYYQIFDGDEILNFKIQDGNIKIYPNKVAHAMMASQVISDYEKYVELDIEDITSNSNNIKGKTIANSNIIILSENGIIAKTQSKSNGEFEVGIPHLVSNSTIQIMVYDKKIFSILYKFRELVV